MYKYRAKNWCPKDLHPTKTSMGKAKRFFPSFADIGQRHREKKKKKVTFWSLCWKLTAKPWPLKCPYQGCHCPTDYHLGLLFHPTHMEGRHTRAAQHHQAEFKNITLNFDLLGSPETLWERLLLKETGFGRGGCSVRTMQKITLWAGRGSLLPVFWFISPQNAKENKYSSR